MVVNNGGFGIGAAGGGRGGRGGDDRANISVECSLQAVGSGSRVCPANGRPHLHNRDGLDGAHHGLKELAGCGGAEITSWVDGNGIGSAQKGAPPVFNHAERFTRTDGARPGPALDINDVDDLLAAEAVGDGGQLGGSQVAAEFAIGRRGKEDALDLGFLSIDRGGLRWHTGASGSVTEVVCVALGRALVVSRAGNAQECVAANGGRDTSALDAVRATSSALPVDKARRL